VLREDYLIGWIKRYIRWLAEITGFIKTEDYEAAARRADLALRELLNLGADSVLSLTDGEILARLTMDAPPPVVRDKVLLVAALLYHLGETAAGKGNRDLARDCWLKSLQVLLGIQLQGGRGEWPEHVPKLAELLERLRDRALPARTEAALIIYYEHRGEFDQAETALFRLLEAVEPEGVSGVVELGRGLYQRLGVLSDEALRAGNLSRAEVQSGLRELEARLAPSGASPGGGASSP
jgi:hypothetical protein